MDIPSERLRGKCEEVITEFTANTLCNVGAVSTYAKTGDKPNVDVRLDNELPADIGGKRFAKMRVQEQMKSKSERSPTFGVLLAETSPRANQDGPFFGAHRLRAGLRASVAHGCTIRFEAL